MTRKLGTQALGNSPTLNVRVDAATLEAAKAAARTRGITLAQFVREAISAKALEPRK